MASDVAIAGEAAAWDLRARRVAVPVTALDSVSPSAVNAMLPVNVATEVAENRTTTFCVAPGAIV